MVGIIRRIDGLGRICIPKEYRKFLGIDNLDELEIICEEDRIIIRKTERGNE